MARPESLNGLRNKRLLFPKLVCKEGKRGLFLQILTDTNEMPPRPQKSRETCTNRGAMEGTAGDGIQE